MAVVVVFFFLVAVLSTLKATLELEEGAAPLAPIDDYVFDSSVKVLAIAAALLSIDLWESRSAAAAPPDDYY